MSDKAELIKEGSSAVEKLTNSANNKTLAFCLVFSMIISVIFIYLYVSAKNENISLLRAQIRLEVERQLPTEVQKQVNPIAEGWNKASGKIDTLIQNSQ